MFYVFFFFRKRMLCFFFFFSSRRRHTRSDRDWSSDVCSSDLGNSACDIASEAARVGASAGISLRRGYWFLPKTLLGVPLVDLIKGWHPVWAQRIFLRIVLRIVVGKYSNYGLPIPEHKIFEAHPTINSELLYYIKQGLIRPKRDIARFEGKTVH